VCAFEPEGKEIEGVEDEGDDECSGVEADTGVEGVKDNKNEDGEGEEEEAAVGYEP
jgi:hypothetical protein